MVWGHAGGPFEGFISLFHMPIFFIASGYCWNGKHSNDFNSLKTYCISKFRTLYVPFVLTNIFFALINNPMVYAGLLPADALLGFKDVLLYIVKSFALLRGVYYLSAPMWFLRVLFVIVIGHTAFEFIIKKAIYKKFFRIAIILICAVISQSICFSGKFVQIQPILSGYMAYNIGIIIKTYLKKYIEVEKIAKNLALFAGSFLILCLLGQIGKVSMVYGEITNVLFFCVSSMSGWIMLYSLSQFVRGKPASILIYIGQHTMSILIWHLLSFKIVSILYVMVTQTDRSICTVVFPTSDISPYIWIAYTIVGVVVPLLIGGLYHKIIRVGKAIKT